TRGHPTASELTGPAEPHPATGNPPWLLKYGSKRDKRPRNRDAPARRRCPERSEPPDPPLGRQQAAGQPAGGEGRRMEAGGCRRRAGTVAGEKERGTSARTRAYDPHSGLSPGAAWHPRVSPRMPGRLLATAIR